MQYVSNESIQKISVLSTFTSYASHLHSISSGSGSQYESNRKYLLHLLV